LTIAVIAPQTPRHGLASRPRAEDDQSGHFEVLLPLHDARSRFRAHPPDRPASILHLCESAKLEPGSWPEKIDIDFVASYIEDHNDELFFQKTLDWQTEHEYRFVTTARPNQPLYASYGDALAGIVVGERFPDWQRPAALKAGRAVDVEPAIMNWRVTFPPPVPLTRRSKAEREQLEASYRTSF
jgi:hypothetical protein